MTGTKSEETLTHETIEEVLRQIIDDWYGRVSSHYVTLEQLSENPGLQQEEELKRFHDGKGHRIKFNKHELDITYGLRSYWKDADYFIEISVNNKVANFDYDDFGDSLLSHYEKTGRENVPTPKQLRSYCYQDIFQLEPNPQEAFTVEQRTDRADIMRLSFRLGDQVTKSLAAHPISSKQLIEGYCVSPFRSIYARVYRRTTA